MSRIPELEAELVASAERLQRQRGLRRPATLVALAAAVVAVVVVVLAVLGVIDTNDADRRPQPVGAVPAPGKEVVVTDVDAEGALVNHDDRAIRSRPRRAA